MQQLPHTLIVLYVFGWGLVHVSTDPLVHAIVVSVDFMTTFSF